MFQNYNLFAHLTIAENLMLAPRSAKKMGKAEAVELARHCLAQVHHGKVSELGPASVLDKPQTEELRDFLAHEL